MEQPMSSRPKAYSYLRFSTPQQALGDSLRRQTEMAERYAAEHGLDLDNDLTFRDLGVSAFSGRNSQSGALSLFRRAVEDGAVEPGSFLLVESLDRVSRQNPRRALRQLEEIVDRGVNVVTLMDGRVHNRETIDDALGLLGVLFIFMRANEESEVKSKRLRAAWGNKRKQAKDAGVRATSVAPEWLSPSAGSFSVIEARAEVVRRIFNETLAGDGQHRIAGRLTEERIPTWRGGKVWHRTYVRKLLDNPAVIGTAVFHETERLEGGGRRRRAVEEVPGYFPAIVEPETWARVQHLLGKRGSAGVARRGRHSGTALKHLLGNLAVCPRCGGTMTRVNKGQGNGRAYLVCTTAKAGGGCEYRSVHVEAVDAAIFANHVELCIDPPGGDAIEAAIRQELAGVRANIGSIVDERSELDLTRRSGPYAPTAARRSAELTRLQDELEATARGLEAALSDAASPVVVGRANRLWTALEAGPQEDLTAANNLLRECFTGVVVDYDSRLLGFRWRQGGETWLSFGSPFKDEREGTTGRTTA
jgi:DNA invertase Pin-like site-specific DNA recombinase